jgi:chromosome partitioning protein
MKNLKTNIVEIANQKGGVGKTTTVTSLAAAFAKLGQRVLIVDFDFQGNASDWLGVQEKAIEEKRTVTHAIQKSLTIGDVRISTANSNIDIIASDISLNWETRKLNGTSRQFQILKRILDCPEANDYQTIIVDTHPSIDPLFESVMSFAHYFLVPVFAEKHPYSGLEFLTKAIEQIKDDFNPMLHFLGILVTRFSKENATHKRFEEKMRELESSTRIPVLKTVIPSSEAVAGASASQRSIFDYKSNLPVSDAYLALAKELKPMLKGKRTGRPQKPPQVERVGAYKDFFKEASF